MTNQNLPHNIFIHQQQPLNELFEDENDNITVLDKHLMKSIPEDKADHFLCMLCSQPLTKDNTLIIEEDKIFCIHNCCKNKFQGLHHLKYLLGLED